METYLHGLMKATNYSIRVLAFTSTGDGLHSISVYCSTDEDVPEAPANIKASALTAESILISWLPPLQKNGMITHYTVYSKDSGRKGQTRSKQIEITFQKWITTLLLKQTASDPHKSIFN
jgi:Down syndrome cell adhesion molecule